MKEGLPRSHAPRVLEERELRRLGADHRYIPLLTTLPGVAWALGYTIAAEIGETARFPSPRKLIGYTGLTPRVEQSSGAARCARTALTTCAGR